MCGSAAEVRQTFAFETKQMRVCQIAPPTTVEGELFARFWCGTGPKGLGAAVRSIWVDSRGLATILDPFQTIFADLGPDRQTSAVETGQMSVLSQQQTSVLSQQKTSGCFGVTLGRSKMRKTEHSRRSRWGPETTPPAAPRSLVLHAPGARIT